MRLCVVGILVLFMSSVFALTPEQCKIQWASIGAVEDLYQPLVGLCDGDFRTQLRTIMSHNRSLSYNEAREHIFAEISNNAGEVCCVYTNVCIQTNHIPDPNLLNVEHSWPQSLGAVGIAKSDLHHLYPVEPKVNSRRGNNPYCEVKTVKWQGGGSRFGTDGASTNCFEPRDEHKGRVARSMLYFAIRYDKTIDAAQESYFRKWSALHPVDDEEMRRHDAIEQIQSNRNPFVDHPEFANFMSDI